MVNVYIVVTTCFYTHVWSTSSCPVITVNDFMWWKHSSPRFWTECILSRIQWVWESLEQKTKLIAQFSLSVRCLFIDRFAVIFLVIAVNCVFLFCWSVVLWPILQSILQIRLCIVQYLEELSSFFLVVPCFLWVVLVDVVFSWHFYVSPSGEVPILPGEVWDIWPT